MISESGDKLHKRTSKRCVGITGERVRETFLMLLEYQVQAARRCWKVLVRVYSLGRPQALNGWLCIIVVHDAKQIIMNSIVTKGKKYQRMPYTAKRGFQVQPWNTNCSMVWWSVSEPVWQNKSRWPATPGRTFLQSTVEKWLFQHVAKKIPLRRAKKTFPSQLEIAIGLKFAGSLLGPVLWNSRRAAPCHHGGIDWEQLV